MPVTPFYARDGIEIHVGDCRDVIADLRADGLVADLLVTDPPYGVGYQSNRRVATEQLDRIHGDDDASWVPDALDGVCKALRRGRHAYVFGPELLLPDVLCARTELIWDKELMGSGSLSSPWGPAHERITFAVHEHSAANRAKGYGKQAARLRAGSVIHCPRPHSGQVARHPTEKPVALLRRLIESSSRLGEVVLDPFVGSGSTLVAAICEGRRGVGIELDENYAQIAAQRCDRALDAYQSLLAACR